MSKRKKRSQNSGLNFQSLEPRKLLAALVPVDTAVVGRYLFYNQSAYDGDNASANAADDNAIAPDKVALLPGETATYQNISNYSRGINGIIIDADLANAAAFNANDIALATGEGSAQSDYTTLGVTPDVTVRAGAGVNGSDRITIVLPNTSVTDEYLQVRLLATSNTGLSADDVFYFGNVVGDIGNSSANLIINAVDVASAKANFTGFVAEDIDNQFDLNKDRLVNAVDIATIKANFSGFTAVSYITAPEAEPTTTTPLGDEIFVDSAAALETALNSVQPGDTIVLEDGTYTSENFEFSAVGTEDLPITFRAETSGNVVLNGSSTLSISGDWLIVEGLNFDGGSLDGGSIVEFRGDLGDATNSRFTNNQIIDYNPSSEDTRYFWVSLYGQNNRVDHNTFSGQNHSGVTVVVWRDTSEADFHLIDNNHFVDRPEGSTTNGYETIRIGTSDQSLSNSFTTVESNLFERTDGEVEIISVKAGGNILRNNTFLESAGTLTLRHGDGNVVEGNYFIGNEKAGSGGVRVIGEDQTIVNNYFEGLDGRAGGAISIAAGGTTPPVNGHATVRNALIANNTIVDVNGAAFFLSEGFGNNNGQGERTALAENVTFVNNLVSTTADPIFGGDQGTGFVFESNIVFGQTLGSVSNNSGFTFTDPQLVVGADGLSRLASNSPAIDAAFTEFASATGGIDFEGQLRGSVFDIGADEFSTTTATQGPVFPGDAGLGHCFLGDGPPVNPNTPTGAIEDGFVVQAEDFSSALDPNGDGDTFAVVSTSAAKNGLAVEAPGGNRGETNNQDAVLVYDIQFVEAGTYTAYYFARGFDGGSNSFYTPDDFGSNPDNTETLVTDGNFTWETGGSYTVANADLNSTLEFQISRRESDAQIDVIVFHLDGGLSDSQLDAIFS